MRFTYKGRTCQGTIGMYSRVRMPETIGGSAGYALVTSASGVMRLQNEVLVKPFRGFQFLSDIWYSTDSTNNGTFSILIEGGRMLIIVEIKLIAPRIEETPAICNEKIKNKPYGAQLKD